MTDNVTIALITGGFTLGGIVISNIAPHFTSANNTKKDKKRNINEERYNKVFSPIQKSIYFNGNSNIAFLEIEKIIFDNFSLATDNLKTEFKKCKKQNKITKDFIKIVNISCKCLENELGYINEKLTKKEKEENKDFVKELKVHEDIIEKTLKLFAFVLGIISLSFFVFIFTILLVDNGDEISLDFYKNAINLTYGFSFSFITSIVAKVIYSKFKSSK